MKENHIGKIKSLMVAIIMLLSVMFVVNFGPVRMDIVSADGSSPAADGEQIPGQFNMTYMTTTAATSFTGNVINRSLSTSVAPANFGLELHGTVRISWVRAGSTAINASGYNISFVRDVSQFDQGQTGEFAWKDTNYETNDNLYYDWDTTHYADGDYWVNMTAHGRNDSGGFFRNCTNGPIKVTVRNTLPGTPGVNQWQGGNHSVCGASPINRQVLPSLVINYEAGDTVGLYLSGSATWTGTFYLYYPVYNGTDRDTDVYNIEWIRYSGDALGTDAGESIDVTFDRAGLWVIDERSDLPNWGTSNADFSSIKKFNETVAGWFWVNTTTDYTMSDLPSSFAYNSSGALSINVYDEDADQPTAGHIDPVIDIRRDNNKTSIRHENIRAGDWTYSGFYYNNSYAGSSWPGTKGFWSAGNYTAYGYIDTDAGVGGGEYNGLQAYTQNTMDTSTKGWQHYNATYGSNSNKNGSAGWLSAATTYNWSIAGPWDPPEHNVTEQDIQVTTNEPYSSVATGNSTMYWGFDGEVNITFGKTSVGTAFATSDVNIWIFDDQDDNVSQYFKIENVGTPDSRSGAVNIFSDAYRSGYIHINMTNWGQNHSWNKGFGNNGTWSAQIYIDYNGDRNLNGENKEWSEEWNTTVEWTVAAGPDAQFKWIDDDGSVGGVDLWGFEKSNNDGIIPYVPTAASVPLDVEFYVYASDGSYFGQDPTGIYSGSCQSLKECAENITISGNSLFTGKLSDFPGYNIIAGNCGYSSGVWSVPIVPTMSLGGGEITIQITAFNSSVSEKISIGGENYEKNGSIVSVTPNDFMIDQENKTLTITVKNSETGVENPYVSVSLYYLDDGTKTASPSTMKPITSHTVSRVEAVGGVYTISFNTTQQTDNQTVAGFGSVKAPRNLTVYVNGSGNREGYALIQMKPVNDLETHISTETFMAGRDYDDVVISCDFAGNSTDTPSTVTADKNSFFMKIVDENGDDVTGTSSSNGVLRKFYNTVLTGAYSFEKDNVYGIDAGTYSIYAWNNTHNSEGHNATFEIKAVEVTCDKALFIWSVDANISATFTITYNGNPANGTLRIDNMSDKGAYNRTWTNCSFTGTSDASGNTSLEISKTKITNGVVTVHDISADVLHPNLAKQYITFWFKPTESGSAFAKAKAQMTVEVPSVTPDPEYIPLGRTTKVYCTATGRGETLSDVFIRLHGQGFDQNSTTDVDGRVAFSVTPASTGNISIDVGETGRTLADTVVYVVAWVIDVDNVAEVNEGEQFTVTVTKEGTTDVVVGATVTIKGIGTDTTDSNGQVTFTAPDVTSDRTYTIKVTATGYAPDPDTNTITVINIPKLIIVIPDEVQATTTFEVAVADDTGGAIVGATITFNEKTYTTGVNGIAKLTAPKTKGDYPIKATFGTYVEATGTVTVTAAPGIPGFELLTLVAALGVAFILFRRRRRR